MAAMRLEQVQRFILGKKIFWGYGHFNTTEKEENKERIPVYNLHNTL